MCDDYKFIRIVDVIKCINQKVNLIGVVTVIGISKQTRGTDCCCTLKIVDESHPTIGISINFFAENFDKLPIVESAGDIIQLYHVVIKAHHLGTNVLFDKKFSSFAIYQGMNTSTFVPYQVSSRFHARQQDKIFVTGLRKWTISQPPETASSEAFSLKDIKRGHQFNLICKVIHMCEVTEGNSMLYVWDGTDAPPVDVHANLEQEFENPLPLQLESSPLSRNVLCKFPTVGTVLRMTADRCPEKLALHLLKVGKWVQFRNISFEVRYGFWCGILLPKSKFSYLANEDDRVLQYQKTYDERLKEKWYRMPLSAFPSPSHITEVDCGDDVPYCTLMDVLSYHHVTAKFRCVVRVVVTVPGEAGCLRNPSGSYGLRLTLEDPTARIHAYLNSEDAVYFFGGYPSIDTLKEMYNALLGVEETDGVSNGRARNPPWVQCCIKSFYMDKKDKWGSRTYAIFGTKLLSPSLDV